MGHQLIAILAQADDETIGVNNKLPWQIGEDLRRFKSLTTDHAVIMGRLTYASIGRPLPKRRNIVVSRRNKEAFVLPQYWDDIEVFADPVAALDASRETDPEPYLIGGGSLYGLLWPHVTRIELTEVHRTFNGLSSRDLKTTMHFDRGEWIETAREAAKESKDVEFVTLERRPS